MGRIRDYVLLSAATLALAGCGVIEHRKGEIRDGSWTCEGTNNSFSRVMSIKANKPGTDCYINFMDEEENYSQLRFNNDCGLTMDDAQGIIHDCALELYQDLVE